MNEQAQHVRLTFTEPPSNKEYNVWLRPRDGGWCVDFSYGRIGSALQTGTKTSKPLAYADALKVYKKLVDSKMNGSGDRYKPDRTTAATEYQAPVAQPEDTGLRPQLLTPIAVAEAPAYIADPAWYLQPKFDGNRVFVVARSAGKHDITVFGANRRGQKIALPAPLVRWAQSKLSSGWNAFVLDGELIGEVYHAFDMLEMNDLDYRDQPCATRLKLLRGLLPTDHECVRRVTTAKTAADKQALYDQLLAADAEGAVFKRADAPYTPGRLPTQVKCKFWESASFIVKAQNTGVRSIELGLLSADGRRVESWGSCTVPTNYPLPAVDAIVECKYLYAVESIYQPQYKGERTDVDRDACVVGQLKFKPGSRHAANHSGPKVRMTKADAIAHDVAVFKRRGIQVIE